MLNYVQDVLDRADIDNDKVRVGVVSYGTQPRVHFGLNDYGDKADVMKAIDKIPYTPGKSNLGSGIRAAWRNVFKPNKGDRPDVQNAAVLISGGPSNLRTQWVFPAAQTARRAGITIYGVGVGLSNTAELDKVVSQPVQGYKITTQDFESLHDTRDELVETVFGEAETTVTSGVPDADTVPLVDKLTPIPETRLKTDSPRTRTTKRTMELTTKKDEITTSEPERFSPVTDESKAMTSIKTGQRFTEKPMVVESSRRGEGVTTGKPDRTTPAIDDIDRTTTDQKTVIPDRKIMPERQETIQPEEEAERTTADVTYITGVKPQVGKTLIPPTTGKVGDLETVTASSEETDILAPERERVTYDSDIIPEERETLTPETVSRTVIPRRTTVTPDAEIVTLETVTGKQPTAKTVRPDEDIVTFERVTETPSTPDRMFISPDGEEETGDRVTKSDRQIPIKTTFMTDVKPEISGTLLPETTGDVEDILEGGSGELLPIPDTTDTFKKITESYDKETITTASVKITQRDTVPAVTESITHKDVTSAKPMTSTETPDIDLPTLQTHKIDPEHREIIQPPVEIPVDEIKGAEPLLAARKDVVLMLDTSTSLSASDFDNVKTFAVDFIRSVDINGGKVRIGVLTYSTEAEPRFNLNSYDTKQDVIGAIREIPYNPGGSNLFAGLRSIRRDMFKPTKGDRPSIPDIAVIFSGGPSDLNTKRIESASRAAKRQGIEIYAVGIGVKDTSELDKVSSQPLLTYRFDVLTSGDLMSIRDDLERAVFGG
ncbi:collagen alpha-1(XII) chain-like [Liolophura sinensis]|uniref:collagen alpha-1(XII) chain-like n=1 Tax=Liolophura sinensis TaxID=3198878 RepID=UPI0031584561